MQLKCSAYDESWNVRDQQKRLALPLHVVSDRQPVYIDLRHTGLLLGAGQHAPYGQKIIAVISRHGNSRVGPTRATDPATGN